MKRLSVIICVSVLIGLAVPVFAQQSATGTESEFYYVQVPIERIYPYSKGYVVTYKKRFKGTATLYLPHDWFNGAGADAKGDIIYMGSGATWPHLTIYYKSGEFDHVRLYVRKEAGHETWGSVPANVHIEDRFEDVETLKIEY